MLLDFASQFIPAEMAFNFSSLVGPGFDPGKAGVHLKLCFFHVYLLFKSSFMFDTLQCKAEGFFICIFLMLGLCFFYLAWFHLLIIHIFCSAFLFKDNELNTYLHISADFHFYNITKEKKKTLSLCVYNYLYH